MIIQPVYLSYEGQQLTFTVITSVALNDSRNVSTHASPNGIAYSGIGPRTRQVTIEASLIEKDVQATINTLNKLMQERKPMEVTSERFHIPKGVMTSLDVSMVGLWDASVTMTIQEVRQVEVEVSPRLKPKKKVKKAVKSTKPSADKKVEEQKAKEAPKQVKGSAANTALEKLEGMYNSLTGGMKNVGN